MKQVLTALAIILAVGLSITVSACESGSSVERTPSAPTAFGPQRPAGPDISGAGDHGHSRHVVVNLSADANQQIAQLRAKMARYHRQEVAFAEGWDVPAPGPGDVCISDETRGGMGFHYTRSDKDLIGDGRVDLFEPEFLVYSPQKNGGRKFSALDYFVPYDTWPHADPPSLLGVPFAREDGFGAYVLHIWIFWHNPAGIFENYNPDVPLC